MKHAYGSSEPAHYEICVRGRLEQVSASWFDDMIVSVDEDASPPQTVISGHVRDQAALYGLISRARDLGLTLVSVRRVESQEEVE
jgi:uncharacterized DUF497 family protein